MAEIRSKLLKHEEKQLCQLFGNTRLCLLYKGSNHGFTAQAFHWKCDGQGPTLVIGYNNLGCIFGGFSDIGFKSQQTLLRDEKAFLFCLKESTILKIPVKNPDAAIYDHSSYGPNFGNGSLHFLTNGVQIPVKNPDAAIYDHSSYGPNFGNGSLHFLTNCVQIPVKNLDAAIYDHSSYGPNFGNGSLHFLTNGVQVTTSVTNNYEFEASDLHGNDIYLADLEVYRVEGIGDLMDSPWRNISWTAEERKRLVELAMNYKPSANNISRSRVLMIGPVGAGKSSFFNSVNSVFRGHVATQAVAGSDATSVTTKYRTYTIKDGTSRVSLPLILCDSMGLEEKTGTGLDIEDISKILDGHVPDRYQFNPTAPIKPSTPGYIESPSRQDKIHCVVLVLDACKVGIISEKLEDKLRQLRKRINQHEVPHLVLLTKVDELCPMVAEDIRQVYRSRAVEKQIHTAAARLGIPVTCILPVKNYSYELELQEDVDILIFHAVQQIMRMADQYFDDRGVDNEE
ncbi:interferon-induced protein 44-like [Ambystoma mexicanum]|uniref:interferon-induced protein 44-like n=1 Tax=Ambystoma mexicanum TaxID=8296 RepID=UPI0037E896F5